jgi:hypothetical protein
MAKKPQAAMNTAQPNRSSDASQSVAEIQIRGGPPGTRPNRKVSEPRNKAPGTSARANPTAANAPCAKAPPIVP